MKNLTHINQTVKTNSPILFRIVQINWILAVICLGGLLIDDRTLMGVSVWLKPLKFSISTGIYILTVGYLITLYPFSARKKKVINGITAWTLLLEVLIIVGQGARGVQSHYNMGSLIDGILYGMMGLLIGINVILMILFIVESIRLKLSVPKSIQWGIFLGWVVIVFGSWVGGQMISQLSHSVAVADGGSGIPFLNWNTKGGDLRIAHFFSIHALQLIPVFGYIISQKWQTTEKNRIIAVTIFALLYAGLIGFVFYQAKQGMPLIAG